MARAERINSLNIKSASYIARYLLDCCETLQYFEGFMFGSSLSKAFSDYDILIIGDDDEALKQLKDELDFAGKELPLDILYMLPEEAEETDFVAKQKCVALSDLISHC